eukprot:COSAG06_NODE_10819_length_1611_cov_4.341270_2_plen_165_part_00
MRRCTKEELAQAQAAEDELQRTQAQIVRLRQVRRNHASFAMPFYTQNHQFFYQDRLGTSIGKNSKREVMRFLTATGAAAAAAAARARAAHRISSSLLLLGRLRRPYPGNQRLQRNGGEARRQDARRCRLSLRVRLPHRGGGRRWWCDLRVDVVRKRFFCDAILC